MIRLVDVYTATGIRDGALEFLYELMKARDPEINISHSSLPTFEQHRQFVTRRAYRAWFLIQAQGYLDRGPGSGDATMPGAWYVGSLSLTNLNEIGVVLMPWARGRGYGPEAVNHVLETMEPLPAEAGVRQGEWIANIAPGNEHSKHIFRDKLGFELIQETYRYQRRKAP